MVSSSVLSGSGSNSIVAYNIHLTELVELVSVKVFNSKGELIEDLEEKSLQQEIFLEHSGLYFIETVTSDASYVNKLVATRR